MTLVYSTAEYGTPVWINSSHVKRIDAQLNEAMRIITGAVKSTQTQWLPILSSIMPSHIRRNESLARTIKKCKENENSQLYQILQENPLNRLKSR